LLLLLWTKTKTIAPLQEKKIQEGKRKAESESGNERQEGDDLTSNKTKGNDPPEKRARTQTGRAWSLASATERPASDREGERAGGRETSPSLQTYVLVGFTNTILNTIRNIIRNTLRNTLLGTFFDRRQLTFFSFFFSSEVTYFISKRPYPCPFFLGGGPHSNLFLAINFSW
jgi:hypothetical protein